MEKRAMAFRCTEIYEQNKYLDADAEELAFINFQHNGSGKLTTHQSSYLSEALDRFTFLVKTKY